VQNVCVAHKHLPVYASLRLTLSAPGSSKSHGFNDKIDWISWKDSQKARRRMELACTSAVLLVLCYAALAPLPLAPTRACTCPVSWLLLNAVRQWSGLLHPGPASRAHALKHASVCTAHQIGRQQQAVRLPFPQDMVRQKLMFVHTFIRVRACKHVDGFSGKSFLGLLTVHAREAGSARPRATYAPVARRSMMCLPAVLRWQVWGVQEAEGAVWGGWVRLHI
jgi:hypothetical protein